MVSQLESLVAVHEHPVAVVTARVPEAPAVGTSTADGDTP
jgi:hypothetical protein